MPGIPELLLILVIVLVIFGPGKLPALGLMVTVTAAAAAGFGLVLATACRTRAQLSGISTIVILGLMSGTAAGVAAGLAPLSVILPAGILARRLGWSWPCAVYVPFMVPVFLCAVLNSTFVTLRQGGIRWRDTFYALDTLRKGSVR